MITTKNPGQGTKQEPLTEAEFERVIDNLDKIHQKTKNKGDQLLARHFYELAEPTLREKIGQQFLIGHLLPYWKKGQRFTRKFWENPDALDPDVTAAFRKRNDPPKMQLRRNEQTLKQKFDRKRQMKEDTVKHVVAQLLPNVWRREATKQALDRVHDSIFERKYEAMLQEHKLQPSHPPRLLPPESLVPKELSDHVEIKIALPKEEPIEEFVRDVAGPQRNGDSEKYPWNKVTFPTRGENIRTKDKKGRKNQLSS